MPVHLRLPVLMLAALGSAYSPAVGDRIAPVPEPDPGRITPPDDPLPPGAVARIGTNRLRSAIDIDRVAISPDGKRLVSMWDHGSLEVWDGRTGLLLRTIPMVQHREEPRFRGDDSGRMISEGVAAMAFASDTGKFHVLTNNGLLRACDLTDGTWSEPLARAAEPKRMGGIRDLDGERGFASPDGTHFAFVTLVKRFEREALRVEVLSVGQAKPPLALDREKLGGWQVNRFSTANKLVGAAQNGATFTINWDVAAGGPTTTLTGPGARFLLLNFALAPDGRTLTAVYAPHSRGRSDTIDPRDEWPLLVYDAVTGREKFRVMEWMGYVAGYTADGTRLFGIDRDEVVIADAATGRVTHRLKGHATEMLNLALSANGTYLATCGGRDRSVIVWNLHTSQPALDIDAPRGPVRTIVFSPDGKTVFTSSTQEHACWLWDAETGKRKQKLTGNANGRPLIATFTPDGRHLVAGYGIEGSGHPNGFPACLWRVGDGALGREFGGHTDGVLRVLMSPDGRHLATREGANGNVFLWETDTGNLVRTLKWVPYNENGPLTFPKEDELIGVSSDRQGVGGSINLLSGKVLARWKAQEEDRVDAQAISPDGRLVASRERRNGVEHIVLRRVATGAEVCRLNTPYVSYSNPVAFSHDGRIVAVSRTRYAPDAGDAVHLFDTTTGKELRTFAAQEGRISALAFSPDGARLATGSTDTTVLIWDLTAKP